MAGCGGVLMPRFPAHHMVRALILTLIVCGTILAGHTILQLTNH